jgi:DNA-binding XRE family transcriptional regulator
MTTDHWPCARDETPRKEHAKSHIPSAASSANSVPFRPGMGASPDAEARLAMHRARVKARQPVAVMGDHPDDGDIEHHPDIDVGGNYRIKGTRTWSRSPERCPEQLPGTFSTRVLLLRTRLKLTPKALARAAGMSTQALVAIESGKTSPNLDTSIALAKALGTPFIYLIAGIED